MNLTDQVTVEIVAQVQRYLQGLDQSTQSTRQFAAAAQGATSNLQRLDAVGSSTFQRTADHARRTASAIDSMRSSLLALASIETVRRLGAGVVEAANAWDGYKRGLDAATGATTLGRREMEYVQRTSEALGASLRGNLQSFTQTTAAARGTTLAGKGVRDIFLGVNEAARVLNLSVEKTSGALLSIQQMISKGNVQTEELRGQLGERLPGAFNLAAAAMGVTTQQLDKMLEAGKVTAAEMLPKLAAKLHEMYGAASKLAAQSPAAQFERLKNAIFELQVAVGNAGVLKTLADGAVFLTGALRDLVQSGALPAIVSALGAVAVLTVTAFAGRGLQALGTYVAGLYEARQATIAQAAAVAAQAKEDAAVASIYVRNAQAQMTLNAELARTAQARLAVADATAVAAAADIRHAQAAVANLAPTIAAADAEITRARAMADSSARAGALSYALAINREANATLTVQVARLTEAMGLHSAALTREGQATATLNAEQALRMRLLAELQVIQARTAETEAALVAALNAEAAAQARAATATQLHVAAASVAMAALRGLGAVVGWVYMLLGGLPGVLLAVGAGLYYVLTRTTETSAEIKRLGDDTRQTAATVLSLRDALVLLANGTAPAKKSVLELKEAQLLQLQQEQARAGMMGRLLSGWNDTSMAIAVLRGEIAQLRDAQAANNIAHLEARVSDFLRTVGGGIQTLIDWRSALRSAFSSQSADLAKEAKELDDRTARIGKTTAQYWEYMKAQALKTEADKRGVKEGTEGYRILSEAADKQYAALIKSAQAFDKATKAKKDNAAAAREAAADAERLHDIQQRMTITTVRLAGEVGGPLNKAYHDHAATLLRLSQEALKEIENGANRAQAMRNLEAAVRLANRALAANVDQIKESQRIAARYLEDLQREIELTGLSTEERRIQTQVDQVYNDLRKESVDINGKYYDSVKELNAALAEQRPAFEETIRQLDRQREATERVRQYWEALRNSVVSMVGSMADATAEWIVSGFNHTRDYLRRLLDIVKQTVAAMLVEWAKTRWIGALGNASGGGGWVGAAVSAFSSMMGGPSMAASPTGAAGGASGGFNYQNMLLQNGGNWALNNGTGWIGSALGVGSQTAGGVAPFAAPGLGGYGTGAGSQLGMVPNYAAGAPGVQGAAGYTPGWGTYAAGAAGLYYGYTQRGGLAGGLAYGALGLGAAGAIGGVLGGTGAIAGATGAFAGAGAAAGLGAAAWIPVVGWILAALALIDSFSGGRVFGTSERTEYSNVGLNVGENGPSSTLSLTKVRQRALFGGRDWNTYTGRGSPEMDDAARQLYDALATAMKGVARRTKDELGPMIEATMSIITKYDKKGKELSKAYEVMIGGRKWEEKSAEDAYLRLESEARIKQLDLNKFAAGEATKLAEKYRENVETLRAAVDAMVAITGDLSAGLKPIAGGETLASVMAYVESIQEAGESLSQAYTRLQQASAQYRNIMQGVDDALAEMEFGQTGAEKLRKALADLQKQTEATIAALNEAAQAAGLAGAQETDLARIRELQAATIARMSEDFYTNVDTQLSALTTVASPSRDYVASLRAIGQNTADLIAQAHQLARAQGQAGASAQQLGRIYALGAQQAARALQQFEAVVQQQSRSLYGGFFSLSDIDADIAALQQRRDQAQQSLQSFGDAMGTVAERANEAINLMIGSLSPYNDQQRLGIALAGLQRGEVGANDVLTIGQRLYASTAAYRSLFESVMRMTNATMGSGALNYVQPSGTSAQQPTVFSPEDRARLAELLEQRERMAAQQRLLEAQEFARSISTLLQTGQTLEELAERYQFNISDFADDLGIKDSELLDYLRSIQIEDTSLQDTVTDNFDRLINVMIAIFGADSPLIAGIADGTRGAGRTGVAQPGRGGSPRESREPGDIKDPDRGSMDGVRSDIRDSSNKSERIGNAQIAATDRVVAAVDRMIATYTTVNDANNPRSTRYMMPVLNR